MTAPRRDTAADPVTSMMGLRITVVQDVTDDGSVLVSNDDSGSMQLCEVDTDRRWSRLTDLGEPATGRYLPGPRRRVVVSVNPSGTERTQLALVDADSGPVSAVTSFTDDPEHIHTLLDVGDDTVVYTTNRRDGVEFDIVRRTVSTGQESTLYDSGGSFDEVAVSRDGALLAATRATLVAASNQVLLLDVATGEVHELSDATVAGEWSELHWLPDGDLVASSDLGSERVQVRRYSPRSGQWSTVLADPAADVVAVPSPTGERWAVVRTSLGAEQLSIRDAVSGSEQLLDLDGRTTVTGYNPLRWSPDGRTLAVTASSLSLPPEAYVWTEDSGVARRTVSNDVSALPALDPPAVHLVPTPDGESVPAIVVTAGGTSGSAVLVVHGGPESQARRSWLPLVAGLALEGHTVVLPNVRGSTGYGRRWLSLDDVDKRLDSVADLAAVHAWLPTVGVDPSRVALWGGSYGGYMVLAGLTFFPSLWAAGVDIVGISSLTSFLENTSAYRRAYREREYGRLETDRAVLEAASPLPVIDRLRAPLFVIHGRNDPRVPLSEAEQVVAAVRANGVDCELLVYDDEGHGLAKRANQLDAYPRAAAFLQRNLGR